MLSPIAPVGSTLRTRVPASAPPCRWKYQYGMPFCIVMTAVSGPKSFGTLPATASSWCAFVARMTTSCGPVAA